MRNIELTDRLKEADAEDTSVIIQNKLKIIIKIKVLLELPRMLHQRYSFNTINIICARIQLCASF